MLADITLNFGSPWLYFIVPVVSAIFLSAGCITCAIKSALPENEVHGGYVAAAIVLGFFTIVLVICAFNVGDSLFQIALKNSSAIPDSPSQWSLSPPAFFLVALGTGIISLIGCVCLSVAANKKYKMTKRPGAGPYEGYTVGAVVCGVVMLAALIQASVFSYKLFWAAIGES